MTVDVDINKIEINEDFDYGALIEDYCDGIEAYDPQIGSVFKVLSVESTGRNVLVRIQNDVIVYLNFAEDYMYLNDVLFKDNDFKNRKDLLRFIDLNRDDVQSALIETPTFVEVTEVKNGQITGSISKWNERNMHNQFMEQLKLNDEVEGKPKRHTRGDLNDLKKKLRYYKCHIRDRNKGGYLGYVEGVKVFVPGSMAHNKKIEDYDKLLGDTIPVMVENYSPERDIFVFSFKKYIQYKLPEILDDLDRHKKQKGVITGVVKFGIFFNFNDYLNGLLHTSEMSDETYEKFQNGEFQNGDEMEFYVKSYTKRKIILTEKSFDEVKENWDSITEKYKHQIVSLKVIKKVSSGYLFEFEEENTRGLLYDVESYKYNTSIKIGEYYDVYVDTMDFESGKIYLKHPKR